MVYILFCVIYEKIEFGAAAQHAVKKKQNTHNCVNICFYTLLGITLHVSAVGYKQFISHFNYNFKCSFNFYPFSIKFNVYFRLYLKHILKLTCNCQYTIIVQTQYKFKLVNYAIQKLNIIHVRLKTQVKGRNMYRYHQERIKTNVDTVVSILFLFGYLLCDCPKLYFFFCLFIPLFSISA
jgi:hypothetical protein